MSVITKPLLFESHPPRTHLVSVRAARFRHKSAGYSPGRWRLKSATNAKRRGSFDISALTPSSCLIRLLSSFASSFCSLTANRFSLIVLSLDYARGRSLYETGDSMTKGCEGGMLLGRSWRGRQMCNRSPDEAGPKQREAGWQWKSECNCFHPSNSLAFQDCLTSLTFRLANH